MDHGKKLWLPLLHLNGVLVDSYLIHRWIWACIREAIK